MSQIWQVLPLVPPEEFAWSPYSGLDALCGNVLLISLDGLAKDGLLSKQDLPKAQPVKNADFPKARPGQTSNPDQADPSERGRNLLN